MSSGSLSKPIFGSLMSSRKPVFIAATSFVVMLLVLAVIAAVFWKDVAGWYALRREFDYLGRNVQGYREYRHRKTGVVFVRLPEATFQMGATAEEVRRAVETLGSNQVMGSLEVPRHAVTVSSFLIGKYEVTQAEWWKIMVTRPSWHLGDDCPVEMVTWRDCGKFCRWTGLFLPTEAEWEYACRGGAKGSFSGSGVLDEMGWYNDNSGRCTHPVGGKEPNAFGLYDMHGNVLEWCQDDLAEDFYDRSPARDPLCRVSDALPKVLRGGSYEDSAFQCRSAARFGYGAGARTMGAGFRVAWRFP